MHLCDVDCLSARCQNERTLIVVDMSVILCHVHLPPTFLVSWRSFETMRSDGTLIDMQITECDFTCLLFPEASFGMFIIIITSYLVIVYYSSASLVSFCLTKVSGILKSLMFFFGF